MSRVFEELAKAVMPCSIIWRVNITNFPILAILDLRLRVSYRSFYCLFEYYLTNAVTIGITISIGSRGCEIMAVKSLESRILRRQSIRRRRLE